MTVVKDFRQVDANRAVGLAPETGPRRPFAMA